MSTDNPVSPSPQQWTPLNRNDEKIVHHDTMLGWCVDEATEWIENSTSSVGRVAIVKGVGGSGTTQTMAMLLARTQIGLVATQSAAQCRELYDQCTDANGRHYVRRRLSNAEGQTEEENKYRNTYLERNQWVPPLTSVDPRYVGHVRGPTVMVAQTLVELGVSERAQPLVLLGDHSATCELKLSYNSLEQLQISGPSEAMSRLAEHRRPFSEFLASSARRYSESRPDLHERTVNGETGPGDPENLNARRKYAHEVPPQHWLTNPIDAPTEQQCRALLEAIRDRPKACQLPGLDTLPSSERSDVSPDEWPDGRTDLALCLIAERLHPGILKDYFPDVFVASVQAGELSLIIHDRAGPRPDYRLEVSFPAGATLSGTTRFQQEDGIVVLDNYNSHAVDVWRLIFPGREVKMFNASDRHSMMLACHRYIRVDSRSAYSKSKLIDYSGKSPTVSDRAAASIRELLYAIAREVGPRAQANALLVVPKVLLPLMEKAASHARCNGASSVDDLPPQSTEEAARSKRNKAETRRLKEALFVTEIAAVLRSLYQSEHFYDIEFTHQRNAGRRNRFAHCNVVVTMPANLPEPTCRRHARMLGIEDRTYVDNAGQEQIEEAHRIYNERCSVAETLRRHGALRSARRADVCLHIHFGPESLGGYEVRDSPRGRSRTAYSHATLEVMKCLERRGLDYSPKTVRKLAKLPKIWDVLGLARGLDASISAARGAKKRRAIERTCAGAVTKTKGRHGPADAFRMRRTRDLINGTVRVAPGLYLPLVLEVKRPDEPHPAAIVRVHAAGGVDVVPFGHFVGRTESRLAASGPASWWAWVSPEVECLLPSACQPLNQRVDSLPRYDAHIDFLYVLDNLAAGHGVDLGARALNPKGLNLLSTEVAALERFARNASAFLASLAPAD